MLGEMLVMEKGSAEEEVDLNSVVKEVIVQLL